MSEDIDPVPPEGYRRIESDEEIQLTEAEEAWLQEDPDDYDWMTEMDKEILYVLMTNLTLTPSIIAENIGRSRPAVSQRLNALQAGGLVEKVERGKYKIGKIGAGYVSIGHASRNGDDK